MYPKLQKCVSCVEPPPPPEKKNSVYTILVVMCFIYTSVLTPLKWTSGSPGSQKRVCPREKSNVLFHHVAIGPGCMQ